MVKSKWKNSVYEITYNSWKSMRARCLFDGNNSKHYKSKGITICKEWENDYDRFYLDMGARPEGTTLDRIDPDGNYEPNNCRWADHREQQNNKKSLTKIEHNGVTKTIGEWAFILDLDDTQLSRAYKRYSKYGCSSYEDIFHDGCLRSKRVDERENKCLVCNRVDTIKWRKSGKLCNTCYHRALRWSKKNNSNIESYPEWTDLQGYSKLNQDRLS